MMQGRVTGDANGCAPMLRPSGGDAEPGAEGAAPPTDDRDDRMRSQTTDAP